jgi:hypothetical protein
MLLTSSWIKILLHIFFPINIICQIFKTERIDVIKLDTKKKRVLQKWTGILILNLKSSLRKPLCPCPNRCGTLDQKATDFPVHMQIKKEATWNKISQFKNLEISGKQWIHGTSECWDPFQWGIIVNQCFCAVVSEELYAKFLVQRIYPIASCTKIDNWVV